MGGPERVFAASRDLVLAFDATGAITHRNPAASARTLPADAIERLVATARKVIASAQPEALEWGEHGKTGVLAWFSTEVTPFEGGALAVSRDITAIRRREQLMVDTHGVAHLGTWDWEVSQPHATWSAELYRIYGLTAETYTPSYEAYLTMVHPDDRQRVIDATNRVFHEHVPYSHDERIFRPDGTMRYLHTWAYPVLDETGKLTHLIGVCQDITDRALVDEELQKLNAELEQRVSERTRELETAMRELEAFNSMVSHDLRAPLSVVQMSSELLAPLVAGMERPTMYVERIQRAVVNMSALMDDLLKFAHIDKGALQPADVDVTALANELVAECRVAAPEREAVTTVADGLRCTADPRLFRFLLGNLISNAWKYSGRQAVTRIEIGRTERDGAPALFVRDNGVGFDPTDATRLFAPFERLRNAKGFAGTGIGLAIVHKIVERHGGHVEGISRPGEGATFYVALPGCSWS